MKTYIKLLVVIAYVVNPRSQHHVLIRQFCEVIILLIEGILPFEQV